MKKLIAFTFAFILALNINMFAENKEKPAEYANKSVKGTIIDKNTNETLAGVEVSLVGTTLKTETDLDGNFTFSGIQPGDYQIKASFISYQNYEIRINVNSESDNKLNLQLEAR